MPDLRVVPDTTCLIGLSAVSLLDLLDELYDVVVVPEAVVQEFGEPLPSWAKPAEGDPLLVSALRQTLGPGEAEVIAVAAQSTNALAVLDDKRARATARAMGVRLTGTLGILLRARREGRLPSMRAAIEVLGRAGFHLSSELKEKACKLAGE